VRVFDHLAAVLARHKAGDQVHRTGSVQGVERNQVFQPRRFGVFEHALHAARFELEHGFGLAHLKQLVNGFIIEGQILEGKIFLARVALDDEFAGDLQNGQRGQAQKVKLHQADRLHVVFVVLTHRRITARLLVQRAKIGQLARCNQHAARVHADVARQSLQFTSQFQQRVHVFFFGLALGQHGLGLNGIDQFVVFFPVSGWQLQGDSHTRLVGNELADAVAKGVAHVEHAAHVTNGGTRCHGAKGGDLADRVFAVFLFHVVNDTVAVALAKVNVKVGHGNPLGVQKALKQQVVLQGIQVGNLQGVSHQRAGAGAAPWAHRAAVVLGPVDEVAHDQKVARETHAQNRHQLKLEPFQIAWHLLVALRRVRVQVRHALFQAFV